LEAAMAVSRSASPTLRNANAGIRTGWGANRRTNQARHGKIRKVIISGDNARVLLFTGSKSLIDQIYRQRFRRNRQNQNQAEYANENNAGDSQGAEFSGCVLHRFGPALE